MPDTQKKSKTASATVLFEDNRLDNLKITWQLGSKTLRLCSSGGPGEGALVLKTQIIRGNDEITIDRAQDEANKWFDSIDVFETAPDAEGEDDEWSDFE